MSLFAQIVHSDPSPMPPVPRFLLVCATRDFSSDLKLYLAKRVLVERTKQSLGVKSAPSAQRILIQEQLGRPVQPPVIIAPNSLVLIQDQREYGSACANRGTQERSVCAMRVRKGHTSPQLAEIYAQSAPSASGII